jgi:outer membrane scaffolding protein for murein synthesis (MipA/OmpV family)
VIRKILLLFTIFVSVPALAETSPPAGWSIAVGAGMRAGPRDEIGADFQVRPEPIFDIDWNNRFFLSSTDGIGWNFAGPGKLRFGVFGFYTEGRRQIAQTRALGLNSFGGEVQGGLFAEYTATPFGKAVPLAFGGRVSRDITSRPGNYAELYIANSTDLTWFLSQDVRLALHATDGTVARRIFGVSPRASAMTGLPLFTPDAGPKDLTLQYALTLGISEHWGVVGAVELRTLLDDARESPFVRTRGRADQAAFHLGLVRKF